MKGSRCRLFDENLVRNIMVTTGLSILDYIKEKQVVDVSDVCDFVDSHADEIIENTIDDMNDDGGDDADDENDAEEGEWTPPGAPPVV